MPSPLIPTPRTDKNGRTVIRHMKPSQEVAQGKKLPIPVLSQESHEKLIDDAALTVSSGWTNLSEVAYMFEEAQTRFKGYSPDTLHRVKSLQAENMNLLMNGLLHEYWDEYRINDYVSIASVAKRSHMYSQQLNLHMDAFAKYDLEPWRLGDPYPLKRERQCKAVLETALLIKGLDEDDEMHLYVDFGDAGGLLPYIKDDALRNLVLHSDDREAVIRTMRERRTTDTEIITAVLSHAAPAISSGVL